MRRNSLKFAFLSICLLYLITPIFSVDRLKERVKFRQKRDAFVCPGDGKWPDENDCGKYHTCQGASETSGWCGPGMSFDTDNQRCEMALAINCKEGDRPDWKPPDNWQGKTQTTTTTTKKAAANEKSEDKSSVANAKGSEGIKEGDKCGFKGFETNKEDCQSYYYCKDNEVKKEQCPDKKLFDDESKGCKEFKLVYCGDRPVNDKDKDQCKSRPNGVYPNIENGCSDFYQCASSKKVKSGDCPNGLKFNMMTLRCDKPANIPAPCGTKQASSSAWKIQINFLLASILNAIIFKTIF